MGVRREIRSDTFLVTYTTVDSSGIQLAMFPSMPYQ